MSKLEEIISEGVMVNTNITKYLQMASWTPVMGVLLICGIKAPGGCNEIPQAGEGLDNLALDTSDHRFKDARRIWQELECYDEDGNVDPLPLEMSPIEFFILCDEENIVTAWLSLIQKIAGNTDPTVIDLAPSHIALLNTSSEIPGKMANTAIGQLVIKVAWKIECETGQQANAYQVMRNLQKLIGTDAEYCLEGVIPNGVSWGTLKGKTNNYDIGQCEGTLRTWNSHRAKKESKKI